MNKKTLIDIENLVVGSGAGGSTTAYELIKKGKEVLILEEGIDINNLDRSNIGKCISKIYKNNGVTPIISSNGGPIIGYGQGCCVGGSTYVNAGYFSNTPEWVYADWLKQNKTVMKYDEFLSLIKEIRDEINICTEKLTEYDGDSEKLYQISKKKGFKVEKCERFSSGIINKQKNNMNNTYHKEILKKNFKILSNSRVVKIKTNGNKAYEVEVKNTEKNEIFRIKFKNLFINCGPISSPHLLMKNNLIKYKKNQNNFKFHINFRVIVKFKKNVNFNFNRNYNPDAPVSIYFLREFEKEGVLVSAANSELPYLLATASHFNNDICNDINRNFSQYAMYIYQIKSFSSGQVKSFFNNPYVDYKFNLFDIEQIKKAILRCSKIFLSADTELILFPIESSKPIKSFKDSQDLSENLDHRKLHLISVHGMSSLSCGDENSLTEFNGKLKNFENIYVNDASILPDNTGESPQASIMAFAKYSLKIN